MTQRKESDAVEILSGVFEGRTTGTPIAFLVRNEDARSKDYAAIAQTFRPGHADYTYWQKYGVRDPRGGGRASARETLVRVGAGAIAKKWLDLRYGVRVRGYLAQLGPIEIPLRDWAAVRRIRSSRRTPTAWRRSRRTWMRCGARATPAARGSTWSPRASRSAGVRPSTAGWTPTSPRR